MWQTVYELVGEGVPAGMQARLTNKAATSLKLGNAPVMILILHRPLVVAQAAGGNEAFSTLFSTRLFIKYPMRRLPVYASADEFREPCFSIQRRLGP